MKVLLCGDLSPTADNAQMFAAGDVQTLFSDAASLFQESELSFVNLECALTESETPIKKIGPALKAPIGTAQTMAKVGITHCGLANNHFFDYGRKGAQDSMQALTAAGIGFTGFGENEEESRRPLFIERGGEKICVIAVCEHEFSYALEDRMGSCPFDPFNTPLDIRAAKEKCDRVIVMYHGGKEHCRYPSPRLRKACHAMAKSGADVILCQHSHCIGCYEEFEGCHILYGQGNFHFIKQKHLNTPGWFDCLAVTYETKENTVKFTPLTRNDSYGIRLANPEESERILGEFAERNRTLTDGTWIDGWREFCESVRVNYTHIAERTYAPEQKEKGARFFAHYLDCEAHSDVWHELFPTDNLTNER